MPISPAFHRRAAIGFATAALVPGARAQAPAVVGSNAPPNTPWEAQWTRFAQRAEAGGVPVSSMTAGQLGSDETILAALRRNRVQVGGFTLAAVTGVVPELALLTMPYLFANEDEAAYVQDTVVGEIFAPLLRAQGLAYLQLTASGWSGIYAKRPVRVPADIKGRKFRSSPTLAHRAFLDAAGADVVPIGLADVIPALETGLVDGGVMVLSYYGPAVSDAAKFFTRTRHYYEGGLVLANAGWFDRLGPAQQAALRAAYDTPAESRAVVRAAEADILAKLAAKGATVIEPTPDEHAAWVAATVSAADRLVRDIGGQAADVRARLVAARDAYRAKR
ncbi:MAG: TRAP transporter substrate-binding protein [Rhodospirillaceae bacterium]|nr:TRAP transporter substrate-binding protein [Rhodospirillaceae bacterium]